MAPETRYARRGALHLAYQILGEGPLDLLLVDQWFSHMEAQWEVTPLAALRERLASFGRLIMFDKRGTGLSDPVSTSALPTIDEWMDDVSVILDEVGSERAALITNIGGGLMAMAYAAAHPERVSHLVLVDCFARFLEAPDFPIGAPPDALEPALVQADEGTGRGIMLDIFAPSLAGDARLRQEWSRYERQAASPGTTLAIVRLLYESDVRPLLPAIRVPTLVIHRTEATGFGIEHGRYLASHIAGSTLVEMPGVDNLIWAGDQDTMVAEIQDYLTGVRPLPEPDRVLATILFTDIVGSTRLAADLGDAAWRRLLGEHHRTARELLARYGGREVKTTGDGIVATFDAPLRAIRCALAMRDALLGLGLEIRAGLHVGEIEVQRDDIAGLAVHIAARIEALAASGEVLVSRTLPDLVVGSGLRFVERGSHALRGVPGDWQLFSVEG
jgi:class 3 adenylate cyclase